MTFHPPQKAPASQGANPRKARHAASAVPPGTPQPIAFSGRLGWVHPAQGSSTRHAAVVLVNGVGRDASCAYRPLKVLAGTLAKAGFTTLRYDHLGEGDSLDIASGEDWVQAWSDGVRLAVEQVKALSGLDTVAVVGLRLGGALAAMNVEGVDAQALLAPVANGRQWLRELTLAGRMSSTYHEDEDAVEAEGLYLPAAAMTSLRQINLGGVTKTAPHVMVAAATGVEERLGEHLSSLGAEVTQYGFPDIETLFADCHRNAPPVATFLKVIGWLDQLYPRKAPPAEVKVGLAQLCLDQSTETIVTFGAGLRGVLCSPVDKVAHKAVVFCNTGGDPKAGIGRFAAMSARSLASEGVASLRFDFAGLGDSDGKGGAHVYATSRAGDFDAAFALLGDLGYHDLTLVGVCSGAFHSFDAAQRDARVSRLLLVNALILDWVDGDSIEAVTLELGKSTRTYLKDASSMETWRRLLTGSVDMKVVARVLAARGFSRIGDMTRPGRGRVVREKAEQIARRGGKIHMLAGFTDGGLEQIERYFGANGQGLVRLGMSITISPNLDHGLALMSSRRVALHILKDLLRD